MLAWTQISLSLLCGLIQLSLLLWASSFSTGK